MGSRFKLWQVALIGVAAGALVVGFVIWRAFERGDARALLLLLPTDGATVGYIDAKALREAGVLDLIAGSKTAEDADYKRFVAQTGFDYRTDLDAVAATFTGDGNYFALKGRFLWKKLEEYAQAQGGTCLQAICTVSGSTAGRNISFQELKPGVLALAVTEDPRGVSRVHEGAGKFEGVKEFRHVPTPVWVSMPGARLSTLPPLIGSLLGPLVRASNVTFAVVTAGFEKDAGFEKGAGFEKDKGVTVRLLASCASEDDAKQIVQQLSSTTAVLQKATAREPKNTPARDLMGTLAAGTFEQRGTAATGMWPIDKAVLEGLAGGGTQ